MTPSFSVVNKIAGQLTNSEAKRLVASYCSEIFPRYKEIFKADFFPALDSIAKVSKPEPTVNAGVISQKELSILQVFSLSKSFESYLIYLILSLARTPLKVEFLEHYLKTSVKKHLNQLAEVGVIRVTGDEATFTSIEQKFPPRSSDSRLGEIYEKLDLWDRKIHKFLKFRERRKKLFLRRASYKQIDLLVGLLEQLDGMIKLSEDMNPMLNDEVVFLEYRILEGKMPG